MILSTKFVVESCRLVISFFKNLIKTRNFWYFGPCRPQFWPERKFDWDGFVIIFLRDFKRFFRFSLRPMRAEIDWEEIDGVVQTPPPPRRWWKIWNASGAQVKKPHNLYPLGQKWQTKTMLCRRGLMNIVMLFVFHINSVQSCANRAKRTKTWAAQVA